MIGHSSTLGSCLTTPVYKRRLDGLVETQAQVKRHKVACPQCSKEMQHRHLARHILLRHGNLNRPAKRRRLLHEAKHNPRLYYAFSPTYRTPLDCPVAGCPGRAGSRDGLRMHFAYDTQRTQS